MMRPGACWQNRTMALGMRPGLVRPVGLRNGASGCRQRTHIFACELWEVSGMRTRPMRLTLGLHKAVEGVRGG